jgi:hypothetical protein
MPHKFSRHYGTDSKKKCLVDYFFMPNEKAMTKNWWKSTQRTKQFVWIFFFLPVLYRLYFL